MSTYELAAKALPRAALSCALRRRPLPGLPGLFGERSSDEPLTQILSFKEDVSRAVQDGEG